MKRYRNGSFSDNYLGGHVSIGSVTIFGENAMHWAVVIRLRSDYLSFRLPLRCFKTWWPMYCFRSPDGTPQSATKWYWGKKARGF